MPERVRGDALEPGGLPELLDVVFDGAHAHACVGTDDEERGLVGRREPASSLEVEQPGNGLTGPSVERDRPALAPLARSVQLHPIPVISRYRSRIRSIR